MTLKLKDKTGVPDSMVVPRWVADEADAMQFGIISNRKKAEHIVAAVNWRESIPEAIEKRRAEKKAAGQ